MKSVEADFNKLKKYCKVIRAICHTQVPEITLCALYWVYLGCLKILWVGGYMYYVLFSVPTFRSN